MSEDFPAAHSMDTTWFATDRAGHVGLFKSYENGHVPETSAASAGVDLLWDLWRLHHPGEGDPGPGEWGHEKAWAEKLGIFYFVYEDGAFDPIGTYGLEAAPRKPLHVDQLPPVLRSACKLLCFERADFTTGERLQPLEYGPCAYWYSDRVAYLCRDGKTVRPIPGMEDRFAEFCQQLCEENPELAGQLVFEAPGEKG